MSVNNPNRPPATSWLEEELEAPGSDRLSDEASSQEYFADRAHRKARKPPRRQTVKKLLESGQAQGRTFGHLGLHPQGSEVLRRVRQIARENATPFTPVEESLL
ncbi:hypothetical protein [Meiothermus sp.]|uniref:hypothetical protein n=1 Tax=Meiothermus sp. TaxID=1955249 RepID=UPI00262ACD21|nr:hypothetical protein [Meiothermus sp.]